MGTKLRRRISRVLGTSMRPDDFIVYAVQKGLQEMEHKGSITLPYSPGLLDPELSRRMGELEKSLELQDGLTNVVTQDMFEDLIGGQASIIYDGWTLDNPAEARAKFCAWVSKCRKELGMPALPEKKIPSAEVWASGLSNKKDYPARRTGAEVKAQKVDPLPPLEEVMSEKMFRRVAELNEALHLGGGGIVEAVIGDLVKDFMSGDGGMIAEQWEFGSNRARGQMLRIFRRIINRWRQEDGLPQLPDNEFCGWFLCGLNPPPMRPVKGKELPEIDFTNLHPDAKRELVKQSHKETVVLNWHDGKPFTTLDKGQLRMNLGALGDEVVGPFLEKAARLGVDPEKHFLEILRRDVEKEGRAAA